MIDESKQLNEPVSDSDHERRACDFQQYYKERESWKKAMSDADASYDTLLASISTLALGATLAKDWTESTNGIGNVFIVIAWIGFACCLGLSLLHRYWSYYTHRMYIEKCDAVFSDWSPDVWKRCDEAYDSIPRVKQVEKLKIWAGVAVGVGIASSLCVLLSERFLVPKPQTSPTSTPFNQIINVFPSTQATTQRVIQ